MAGFVIRDIKETESLIIRNRFFISELLLGELFGAGVFVTTVVAGSICIVKPFKLMERPFLRDVVFYMFAGFWAFFIFYR